MILLIPLGGIGARFSQNGYKMPKALIRVMGKPILYWLLDHLSQIHSAKYASYSHPPFVYIPYNKAYTEYRFESLLRKQYPHVHFKFLCLQEDTRGAAETIYQALDHLKEQIPDQPILCLDGDNFYTCDIVSQWNGENSVFTFHDTQEIPLYSYVCIGTQPPGKILNIVEKEKISDHACTGAYGFASWHALKDKCHYILDHNIRQKGEFYTSTVIQEMLKNEVTFVQKSIDRKEFICLGTPTQVRLFCHNYPRYSSLNNKELIQSKRYCFDLDNTLVSFPTIPGDYTSVEPIVKNIEFLKYLKRFGHIIIIYTARRMKTHGGNTGRILKDIGKITFDTLDKFDIPYDEIYFGKPEADVYIDDLALNAYDDLEKELGYYETMIKPRDFNSIRMETMQLCRKESVNLDGEIYYYQNIPSCVKDMFPIMVDFDIGNTWYSVEKVNGITASNLYLSQLLTTDQLKHMMNSLYRLQQVHILSSDTNELVDIYANYIPKMTARYQSYDYSRFPKHNEMYASIVHTLSTYKGKQTVVHGDPVFTNILINDYGKIKFIDMRGKVGDTLTIYGDYLYDWAKMYQSLIGYDEIHEGKRIDPAYKEKMVACFEQYLGGLYDHSISMNSVKQITRCLLFSLIPLHDNAKCHEYYSLLQTLHD
jgi:capsule biosynthesis phosphatase